MNRGVLIFAFNNSEFNYFKQANWVADRVNKFLDLPVTIVTDEKSLSESKHNIIIKDAIVASKRHNEDWLNANRFQAYDITPYEETIVIDSDYIVSSNQLNLLFDSPYDFLCHRNVYDVANKNSLEAYQTFGQVKFPHYWATVLFFRESDIAEVIFDSIQMVKDNYLFYSKLYKFPSAPFRNDHAVSIAMSIAYGHRLQSIPTIPWTLPTAVTDIDVTQITETEFELKYNKHYRNKVRPMSTIIKDHDFHCLNKKAMEMMIENS